MKRTSSILYEARRGVMIDFALQSRLQYVSDVCTRYVCGEGVNCALRSARSFRFPGFPLSLSGFVCFRAIGARHKKGGSQATSRINSPPHGHARTARLSPSVLFTPPAAHAPRHTRGLTELEYVQVASRRTSGWRDEPPATGVQQRHSSQAVA